MSHEFDHDEDAGPFSNRAFWLMGAVSGAFWIATLWWCFA